MSNYPAVAAEAGDKYLATLAENQDRIIEFVKTSREFMPAMPAAASQTPTTTPFAMPDMLQLANAQFKFATQLLEQQRKFFVRLYGQPAAGRATRAATSAGRTKKRTTAKKTAAKKPTAKSATAADKPAK